MLITPERRRGLLFVLIALSVAVLIVWPPVTLKKKTPTNRSLTSEGYLTLGNVPLAGDNLIGISDQKTFQANVGFEMQGSSFATGLWVRVNIPNDPRIRLLTNNWAIAGDDSVLHFWSGEYRVTNCVPRAGAFDHVFPRFGFDYDALRLVGFVVEAGIGTNIIKQSRVHIGITSPTNGHNGTHLTDAKAKQQLREVIGASYTDNGVYFAQFENAPGQPGDGTSTPPRK